MILTRLSEPPDLRPLLDASKALLGYRVHVAFKTYFDVLGANVQRWHKSGLIVNLLEPSASLSSPEPFDLNAIDLESLTSLLGVYFYLLIGHKNVNKILVLPYAGKRVLYLRGYDFAFTLYFSEGLASEARSVDTQRFNTKIDKLASDEVCIIKVMSPDEAYWETAGLGKYFSKPDLNPVMQKAEYPFRSAYLNALTWKQGLLQLLERADYFVVYVSSLTPSAMWELEQLETPERSDRVTVVFDTQAIANKGGMLDAEDHMQSAERKLIWPKGRSEPGVTPEEYRSTLATKFLVVSPEEFEENIDTHLARIRQSSAAEASGANRKWIEFDFYPSLPEDQLASLREFCAWIKTRIMSAIEPQQNIASLLLFLNDVQLWIYTTLLLGEHDETGRALAIYAATLNCCARAAYLEDHVYSADYWGVSLLASGTSHEFESIYDRARTEFEEIKRKAGEAVTIFLEKNARGQPGFALPVIP
jgi:hypothetical protein